MHKLTVWWKEMTALRVDDGNGSGKKVAAPKDVGTIALMDIVRPVSPSMPLRDRLKDFVKPYRVKVEERDELMRDVSTMLSARNVDRAIEYTDRMTHRYFGRNVGLRYTFINHVWYDVNRGEIGRTFGTLDESERHRFLSHFAKVVESTAEAFERHVFKHGIFETSHRGDERRRTKGGAADLRRIAGEAYLKAGLEADAHRVFEEGVARHIRAGFDASAVRIDEAARELFNRRELEDGGENGSSYHGGPYL